MSEEKFLVRVIWGWTDWFGWHHNPNLKLTAAEQYEQNKEFGFDPQIIATSTLNAIAKAQGHAHD